MRVTPARAAIFSMLVATIAGCGPTTRTAMRMGYKPYDVKEYRQTKDGLTVENKELKELPSQFFANGQACNDQGVPVFKADLAGKATNEPEIQKFSFLAPGQQVYQVAITNENENVVRLNSAVIRLFDPAGNALEPVSKEDAVSELIARRPCASTNVAVAQFKTIKFLDRNVELLPKMTWTGWLVFQPASNAMPGIWKLALYDLPTQTDPAGNVTRRTRFELRTVSTKYIDTYVRAGPFEPEKLTKSEEAKD